MKLVSAQNPSYTNLRRYVGEAGDEYYGNSFFLDFFPDRSAATCSGSSGGGQDHSSDSGAGELLSNACADFFHLAWHGAGARGDEVVIVKLLKSFAFLQDAHGIQRDDPVRVLVDGGGVVTCVLGFELALPEVLTLLERILELSRSARAF